MAELWPFIRLLVKKWRLEPLPLDDFPPLQKSSATLKYDII